MQFKEYLLQENTAFLEERISDVLSALQDLNDSSENMGVRHLVSNAEKIVRQIRRIIHTHWPEREEPRLKVLQKCGVSIMKAIEEKDDLQDVLKSCQENIEEISGDDPSNNI
jgi:ATP-dependent protease HslVU (ClpYQ) ATPase subunit